MSNQISFLDENLDENTDENVDELLEENTDGNFAESSAKNKKLTNNPKSTEPTAKKTKKAKKAEKPKHSHYGHRSRLKNKFLNYGIDSLEDHEVIELLLYYAIPNGDTNETAHRLYENYGSIANIFEAENHNLQEINGVGAHTAFLLNFIPQLSRRYFVDRWKEKAIFANTKELFDYIKTLFVGRNKETFFLICLNSKNQVRNVIKLSEGTVGEVVVYPSKVVEIAISQKTRSVVFAHNHPGGNLKPSSSDVDLTIECAQALQTIGVQVLDHIIVSGDDYYSFAERGFMQTIRQSLYK